MAVNTGLRYKRFSSLEIRDLLKAWAVISLVFAIAQTGLELSALFFSNLLISAIAVGSGFLLHELGHKFVAQRYGLWAEFRAYDQGLLMALVLSFFGMVFAAPGAVMIHGHTSPSRIGKIGAAGPAVNFVLAMLFLLLGLINPFASISRLFSFGAQINAVLGLFNLIPFAIFDGKKIFNWHKGVYALMVITGFLLLIFSLIFSF